ncbi:MAG: MBL fold metallo-hydrolase [Pseudomonadota bacterium]
MKNNQQSKIKITIVYDNNAYNPELTTAWGFACIIEMPEQTILFDTGEDGRILLENMGKMGITPQKIDMVFLSHIHSDHTGGLIDLLKQNSKISVYYPHSFPEVFEQQITALGAKAKKVDLPQEIAPNIFTTGEMGGLIKEQSLVIKTNKGLLIITGCSHPGIVKIINQAKKITQAKPYLVIGGFHLRDASTVELNAIINDFKLAGVRKVGPAHCSGQQAGALFKKAFGNNYIPAGAGTEINIY